MKRNILIISALLALTIGLGCSSTAFATENNNNIDLKGVTLAKLGVCNGQTTLIKNDNLKSSFNLKNNNLKSSASYPEYYNLAEIGECTSAKNQGNYGSCWAFGALASLESSVIKQKNATTDIDLSERHLTWFNYNGKNSFSDQSLFAGNDTFDCLNYSPMDFGGNNTMSVSTLLRRYGAADESVCEYNFASGNEALDESLRNKSSIYLESAELLPNTVNTKFDEYDILRGQTLVSASEFDYALNTIKEKIMNVGAVDFSYYDASTTLEKSKYFNSTANAYYYNALRGYKLPNHEVCIVGWNDNFSKNNFKITPPGKGAWIVKNSRGSSWGNNGYFYISYYDLSASDFTSYKAENAQYKSDGTTNHTYKNIYQYDGLTFGSTQKAYSNKMGGANLFTARNGEIIEAVSTICLTDNFTAHYKIYKNIKDENDPESGTLVADEYKTFKNAGYYTIPLENKIILSKGEKYSVIIQISIKTDGTDLNVFPVEMEDIYYVDIDVADGSFYMTDGINWIKTTSSSTIDNIPFGNATIKAYTNDLIYGDANSDGEVTIDDVTYIQMYIAKLVEFDELQIAVSDFNKNNIINIMDASAIQLKMSYNSNDEELI